MGMSGNYVMVDENIIKDIQSGTLSAVEFLYDENNYASGELLDIDKSWHAIHFTLTGQVDKGKGDSPLLKVVMGGQPLCDEDVGYGSLLYLSVLDVKETNAALQAVSNEEFTTKFDVPAMRKNDIYHAMNDENADVFLEYCLGNFNGIKAFFEDAAFQYKSIIFYIN